MQMNVENVTEHASSVYRVCSVWHACVGSTLGISDAWVGVGMACVWVVNSATMVI